LRHERDRLVVPPAHFVRVGVEAIHFASFKQGPTEIPACCRSRSCPEMPMSTDAKKSEILERATAATTKRITVRLDKLKIDLDRFCHRDPKALSEESLTSLMQSLTLEGV